MHSKDFVSIKTAVCSDNIKILLEVINHLQNIKWRVQVIHDRKVREDFPYGTEQIYYSKIYGEGLYLIRVYVALNGKILEYTQKSIHLYTKDTEKKYKEFIQSIVPSKLKSNNIPLFCPQYPYQNMAVVYLNKNVSTSKKIRTFYGMQVRDLIKTENGHIISITQRESRFLFNNFYFSGKAKYENRILIGQNDIEEDCEIKKVLSEIGIFTAVYSFNSKIIFANDYFGLYRIYYYKQADFSIISNNYHMLLLILKEMNIKCSLNIEEAIPLFLSSERGFLEQRITHNMDVEGVKQLPIDKYFEIDEYGINIREKEISNILNSQIDFDQSKYEDYLNKAVKDIESNIRVGSRNDYKRIIVDLTGGKDSRTVVAALTDIDNEYREKIYINSKEVSTTNDKKIFIGINNILNYQYDDMGENVILSRIENKEYQNRSFFLGNSYSRPQIWEFICKNEDSNRSLHFTGAGEMILRPTLAASFPNLTYNSIDELIDDFIVSFENSIIDIDICRNQLKNQLRTILNELPGQNLKEKFNNHFLFFRNVYHFGMETIIDSIETDCEQWQPLWSKNALIAFKMCMERYGNMKFQIDLIAKMNPVLAILPFENGKDNVEINRIKESLILPASYKEMKIVLDEDETKWKNSMEKKKSTRKLLNSEEKERISKENTNYNSKFYVRFLDTLKKLLIYKDGVYANSIGLDLWFYIQREKEKYEGGEIPRSSKFLFNKIVSLVDEIEIVDSDRGWE